MILDVQGDPAAEKITQGQAPEKSAEDDGGGRTVVPQEPTVIFLPGHLVDQARHSRGKDEDMYQEREEQGLHAVTPLDERMFFF